MLNFDISKHAVVNWLKADHPCNPIATFPLGMRDPHFLTGVVEENQTPGKLRNQQQGFH